MPPRLSSPLDPYTKYYLHQSGGAAGDLGTFYRASYGYQRGRGFFGKLFRGFYRFAKPLFISGAKRLGKEILHTGSQVLTDVVSKKPDEKVGDIIVNRLKRRADEMTGSGGGLRVGTLMTSPCIKKRCTTPATATATAVVKTRRRRRQKKKKKRVDKKGTMKNRVSKRRKTIPLGLKDIFSS